MPTVDELYSFLSTTFPSSLSCDWDNDGLMVAEDPTREVFRVLCTLDVTEDAVDYAIQNKFDVIVSHHPMIFKPLKGVNYADPVARKAIKLIRAGISVMSFHTRLDAASGGVSEMLAKIIGLTDIETIECDGETVIRIGNLPEAQGCTEFAASVKRILSAERVLYSQGSGEVKRVAVCGGDGKDYIAAVKAAGADSYLTGQLSYNIMAESDYICLNMFEAGHFHSEDFISVFMTKMILNRFTQVKTAYFNSNRVKSV